jgi:uncharacterized protein
MTGATASAPVRGDGRPEPSAPAEVRRRNPLSGALVGAVRGYQLARSGRPTGCRFTPSCSSYAIEAVQRHGIFAGSRLAVRRLLRCRPWGGHGFDPVPDRRTP